MAWRDRSARFLGGALGVALAATSCQSHAPGEASGPTPCLGKCDAVAAGMAALPVAVRSLAWDGRIAIGARLNGDDQGCRVMVVRPERIERNAGGVGFPPSVFSQGLPCPSELGAHAVTAEPGLANNPFVCDAAGTPDPDGEHQAYRLRIIAASDPTPDDEREDITLTLQQALVVVAQPGSEDAEVVAVQWLAEAIVLQTQSGQPLLGLEPTLTADGRLLVYQGHPSNALDDADRLQRDSLVYSRLLDPEHPGAGWTEPRSLTELFSERELEAEGMTLGERYPLAAAQLRAPDGSQLAPGTLYRGAHPWISRDGSELFHTATMAGHPARVGERGRRGAASVIGRATGYALRHIDGPINPSREAMTELPAIRGLNVSPGFAPGFRAPYRDVGVLPFDRRAPVYPLFGSVFASEQPSASYSEVDFRVFADRDYLVYLPMNENITTDGDFTYDITRTPDLSGNFNTGLLRDGARFVVEQFGTEPDSDIPVRDDNAGAHGRALFFAEHGFVEVPHAPSLTAERDLSVEMFVMPLVESETEPRTLLEWPGVAELVLEADGRVVATVYVEDEARSSGTVGPALALDGWTHVAFTYEGRRGVLATYIAGERVGELEFGAGDPDAPTGESLVVGPAGELQDPALADTAVVALDEVAVSRIVRSEDELVFAATGALPEPLELDNDTLTDMIDLPLGLDPGALRVPARNRMNPAAVELGKALFFDPRLSGNGEVSCATCHDPELAFTDGLAVARAIDGTDLKRATQPVFNRALSEHQFWDGRSDSLEAQALAPIVSPREMGGSVAATLELVSSSPGYVELFEAAFGSGPTPGRVAAALASFQRAQLAGDSPVDRFEAGDTDALTPAEQRGRALFHGKARCVGCHDGSNYSDEGFHNVGFVGGNDRGKYPSTRRRKFDRAFKTPTLRNIAVTGPYFHNGSVETLEEVVALYNAGGLDDDSDWEIRPLALTEQEQADLLAFLQALTSPNATTPIEVELPE